ELVVKHLWTLCTDPKWPRGDMNFARAMFTEKAFPENETVWTGAFQVQGTKEATNEFVYEHRIKQRSQYEVLIPVGFQQTSAGVAQQDAAHPLERRHQRAGHRARGSPSAVSHLYRLGLVRGRPV